MTRQRDKRIEQAAATMCDSIETLALESGADGEVAQREAYEAIKALDRLEWFGNFSEEIQRDIEFSRQRITEFSAYDSVEELRQSIGGEQ